MEFYCIELWNNLVDIFISIRLSRFLIILVKGGKNDNKGVYVCNVSIFRYFCI